MTVKAVKNITVAVSSCLLGDKVRYDGGDKFNQTIAAELGEYFSFVGICPEMAIGMGVPRKPVRLVSVSNEIRVKGVEDASVDVTDLLYSYAGRFVQEFPGISGYIFKQRSPSCGLAQTPVFDLPGHEIDHQDGLFAAAVRNLLPGLPVIDEESLEVVERREQFIQAVLVYHDTSKPLHE